MYTLWSRARGFESRLCNTSSVPSKCSTSSGVRAKKGTFLVISAKYHLQNWMAVSSSIRSQATMKKETLDLWQTFLSLAFFHFDKEKQAYVYVRKRLPKIDGSLLSEKRNEEREKTPSFGLIKMRCTAFTPVVWSGWTAIKNTLTGIGVTPFSITIMEERENVGCR